MLCSRALSKWAFPNCTEVGYGGVKIGDAGTGDAGGVGQFQRLAVIDLIFHAGLRHPVAEVLAEICCLAIGIMSFHVAVFIAQSGAGNPFTLMIDIIGIGSGYLRSVVEEVTGGGRGCIVEMLCIIAAVLPEDILGADFEFVAFP